MSSARADEFVVVGRIRRPHGVRGEVSVEVVTDVPDRFAPGVTMTIVPGAGGLSRRLEIASVRAHTGQLLLRFVGVEDRDQAAELRGASLEIEPDRVPPAPAGYYYYYQLVGCQCIAADAGEIGEVNEVIEDGGGLLLSVVGAGSTFLIPFVEEYTGLIDLDRGRIELNLPPGLLELCVSRS